MNHIDQQLGEMLQASLAVVVENLVPMARQHGDEWLMQQPEGWARDGARQRVPKVVGSFFKRGVMTLLEGELRERLKHFDPIPPEVKESLGNNPKAMREFHRILGRVPTEYKIHRINEDKLVFEQRTEVNVYVTFIAPELAVMSEAYAAFAADESLDMCEDAIAEMLPSEERTLCASLTYDASEYFDNVPVTSSNQKWERVEDAEPDSQP